MVKVINISIIIKTDEIWTHKIIILISLAMCLGGKVKTFGHQSTCLCSGWTSVFSVTSVTTSSVVSKLSILTLLWTFEY